MKITHYPIKHLCSTAVLLFLLISANAQLIVTGTVKDPRQQPIPYCSIGIKNSRVGTIADENGSFKLVIPDSLQGSYVIFSAIGFQELRLLSSEIARAKSGGMVTLKEKVFDMPQVVITGAKLKEKIVGQQSRPMLTFSRMFDEKVPSIEQGNIYKIFGQTVLKAYNFYIMPSSRFSSITLKLNIYSVKNNLPDTSLLSTTITYQARTTGWQRIDLSSYQLTFTQMEKIAVTLQLVAHEPGVGKEFVFGLSAKKAIPKDLLFRYQSQGSWESSPGSFIANLELKYSQESNKVETVIDQAEQQTPELKKLASFYKHKEKAAKSGYGKSKHGKFIDLGDAKIYVEEYGEGSPLLLLHGNNGSMEDFYLQIPYLAKHFKVISIDTRGQGRSTDLSSDPYTYDRFAGDLSRIVEKLDLKKVSIVGWSDGGNTALSFTLSHPQKVDRVIAIGANLSPSGIKDSLLNSFRQSLSSDRLPSNHRLISLMLEHPNIMPSKLQQVSSPVLVIAGSDDEIKEEHTRMIAAQIPRSSLLTIPAATHYVPFEKPDQLNRAIVDFLKKSTP